MGTLALAADERVVDVKFTKHTLSVDLGDGRTITVPLAWYPRLLNATAALVLLAATHDSRNIRS